MFELLLGSKCRTLSPAPRKYLFHPPEFRSERNFFPLPGTLLLVDPCEFQQRDFLHVVDTNMVCRVLMSSSVRGLPQEAVVVRSAAGRSLFTNLVPEDRGWDGLFIRLPRYFQRMDLPWLARPNQTNKVFKTPNPEKGLDKSLVEVGDHYVLGFLLTYTTLAFQGDLSAAGKGKRFMFLLCRTCWLRYLCFVISILKSMSKVKLRSMSIFLESSTFTPFLIFKYFLCQCEGAGPGYVTIQTSFS